MNLGDGEPPNGGNLARFAEPWCIRTYQHTSRVHAGTNNGF